MLGIIFSSKKRRAAAVVLFSVFISVALSVQAAAATVRKVSAERQKFISQALKLQGIPYVYGGKTPSGFDCSGFVCYAVRESFGVKFPASAQQIYDKCMPIPAGKKEPGDLIFFKADPNGNISHVGIYLGKYHSTSGKHPEYEGKRVFISAVSDGPVTGTVIRAIDERYWQEHFYAYGRFLMSTQEAEDLLKASPVRNLVEK